MNAMKNVAEAIKPKKPSLLKGKWGKLKTNIDSDKFIEMKREVLDTPSDDEERKKKILQQIFLL